MVKTPTFVEALHRENIKKLAKQTEQDNTYVLDELNELDEYDDDYEVMILPDFFYG